MFATAFFPVVVFLFAVLIHRYSNVLKRLGNLLFSRIGLSDYSPSLISLLVVVPPVMLLMASLLIPLYAPRHMLLLTPYLLLVISIGVVYLAQRSGKFSILVVVPLLLVLGVIHYAGAEYQKQHANSPVDYQGLAQNWLPVIEESDLIFLRTHWRMTPIFYYVNADHYHFVAADYEREILHNLEARVWVVDFDGITITDEAKGVLSDYLLTTGSRGPGSSGAVVRAAIKIILGSVSAIGEIEFHRQARLI